MEETFTNNDNNERDEENALDRDYFNYLELKNNINSASVKKDDNKNMKRINSFDNLEEEEFHSNTELNKKIIKFKVHKTKEKEKEKTNEDVKEIHFIQKKHQENLMILRKRKKIMNAKQKLK